MGISVCGAAPSLDQNGIESVLSSKESTNDVKHIAYMMCDCIKMCTRIVPETPVAWGGTGRSIITEYGVNPFLPLFSGSKHQQQDIHLYAHD